MHAFWTLILTLLAVAELGTPQVSFADQQIAIVEGQPIQRSEVERNMRFFGWLENDNSSFERMRDRLIERELVRSFLRSRRVEPSKQLVETQMGKIESILGQEGDADKTLERLGLTREHIERELKLSLAWSQYVRQVVTEQQLRDYFQEHKKELDGTKRRASQIFLKVSAGSSEQENADAKAKLLHWRQEVKSGTTTFEQAAREHSQSPSAEKGGDMGLFRYSGQMPASIAEQAFSVDVGEMSEPFQSKFGWHLIKVTEEVPGQFSLEDVRPQLWKHFEDVLWGQTVERIRKQAKIQIVP